MSGHAESAPESGGLADLASFLADTPETDPIEEEEAPAEDSPEASDTETEANDQPEESEGEEPTEEEDLEAPTPDRKIKVPVTDDEGKPTGETQEVTEEELIKGHLRQAVLTKKTQALAERENQSFNLLAQKHDEITNHYAEKLEVALSATSRLLEMRSPAEMAQLAHADPAAWVAESQRQKQINELIGSLENEIKSEKALAKQRAEQAKAAEDEQIRQRSWAALEKANIDKPKLLNIYERVMKTYGYGPQHMQGINDSTLVFVLQDALAYRELKAKAPEVTKKAQDAPRLPSKQATAAQDRQRKELDNRFKSGRAKLNDLAAYLR